MNSCTKQGSTTHGEQRVKRASARIEHHINAGLAKLSRLMNLPIELEGDGCFLYDQSGAKYLNCGGYCVFLTGHRHPSIQKAVLQQLVKNPLASRLLVNEELGKAGEKLAALAPQGLDYVWLANSGAEAVEAGLKLAMLSGKTQFVAMEGGYHGKTLGALSVTHNPVYRGPFTSLLPCRFIPFGNLEILEATLKKLGAKACVIVEPIQSEAGVRIPPRGYLKGVESLCRQHGAMLIVDEISTGMGRLGTKWGVQPEGVLPDILLAGKALSGGFIPVGATIASKSVFAPLNQHPLLHTSTFAGNPLASVAVQATIDVIQKEHLIPKAQQLGEKILGHLQQMTHELELDIVASVRGCGLLIGIEFTEERFAGDFLFELFRRKVLVSHSLNAHKVVRFTPPAIMGSEHLNWLFMAIQDGLLALKNTYRRSLCVQ